MSKIPVVMVVVALTMFGAFATQKPSHLSEIRKNLEGKWEQLRSAHEERMNAFDFATIEEQERLIEYNAYVKEMEEGVLEEIIAKHSESFGRQLGGCPDPKNPSCCPVNPPTCNSAYCGICFCE